MLELRPNCECCDRDLPPGSAEARICSLECTFCVTCAEGILRGRCPNCGGELVPRPRRPESKLTRFPASVVRITKPQGCTGLDQGTSYEVASRGIERFGCVMDG